mmetsp:Transcript_94686/g.247095  ORF Transcript_94686/g.247095 Transcript_94686/m.247095 type:complete len:898 (+) Transcript_94686:105-2798(+)
MSAASAALFLPRQLFILGLIIVQLCVCLWFLFAAYDIRLYPIRDFGYIIHEFDPWFNYRATEYLAEHGLEKFFKWYDYESWYPLGRPVGTTIYPGMQMTAVAIWEGMKKVPEFTMATPSALLALRPAFNLANSLGFAFVPSVPDVFHYVPMSVNDICCMIPPWFGSIASLFTGLLAYEISRSVNAGLMAVGIMAIIPAHLMRSVGGEFDNEAVAVAAIVCTFWLWLRSVRTPSSWPYGVFAGASYAYAAAAWGGGPIFVLNMVGVHALMLVVLGRFSTGVHKAYTLFWVIGTAGAIQIPVIGWQPIRSLEQLGPALVCLGYQVLGFCDMVRRYKKMDAREFVRFRVQAVGVLIGGVLVVGMLLYPTGYFGPLSSRIRGLFVKHTKTGNPLVDSVAEHQPASSGMYTSYLNLPLDYALLGGIVSCWKRNNGFYFLVLYGFIAQHFAGKMSRLVLICGPIVAVSCAIWCGFLLDQLLEPFLLFLGKKPGYTVEDEEEQPTESDSNGNATAAKEKAGAKAVAAKGKAKATKDSAKTPPKVAKKSSRKAEARVLEEWEEEERPGGAAQFKKALKNGIKEAIPEDFQQQYSDFRKMFDSTKGMTIRAVVAVAFVMYTLTIGGTIPRIVTFVRHCDNVAQSLSNPQVVYSVRDRTGKTHIIDDYLKGYQWIDQNTPKDARVMAWWDYGYQITGIAKRTSIADGNTWNHEHIATLGRTLTSPEKKAWNVIRHMADYVLVWAGGGGDDLAKSPHLARIGNSVFPDHCGDDDPKCNKFSFYSDHTPTPMMAKSLLYKLVMHGENGVQVNQALFKEVHKTQNGLMRVFKVMNISEESKAWVKDPKNRVCDAPGSWYCVGQYPPALEKLISKRKNFAQLEDFNKVGQVRSAYSQMIEQERSGKGNSEL